MADQPITTSIDSLVKYLKEHGDTDTTTLSRVLNVNEGTIVDWSDILEKAGMVKITYKVGKMYLSTTGETTTVRVGVEKAVADVKKEVIENDIQSQQEMLNNIRSKIEIYSRTVKNAEVVFQEQSGEAKKALDKISVMERDANKYFNSISEKHQTVVNTVDTLEKEIKTLENSADQIRQFNLDTTGAKGVLDDIANKIMVFNSNMKQMEAEFNRAINEQRNQLRAVQASVKVEVNVLKDAASAESKKISEYENALKDYKRKSELQSAGMKKTREQMLDEAERTRNEVLSIYAVASNQVNTLNQSLKSMKESWGLLAVFNDRLDKIKKDIDDLSKKLDAQEAKLNGVEKVMKSPKGKTADVSNVESEVKELHGQTNEINSGSDKLTRDMEELSK